MRAFVHKAVIAAASGLTAACLAAPGAPAVAPPAMIVDGRVVATREVSVFTGDVELVARAYLIERSAAPGKRLVALAGSEARCPAPVPSQPYRFGLVRRAYVFGLRGDEDRKWVTGLEIGSCVPLRAVPAAVHPSRRPPV